MLTLAQAAESLGLSISTLREQVHRGRLAAIKPGRDWLVDEAEVERYRLESLGQAGRPAGIGMAPTGRAIHPVPGGRATHPTPGGTASHPIPGIRGARTKGR